MRQVGLVLLVTPLLAATPASASPRDLPAPMAVASSGAELQSSGAGLQKQSVTVDVPDGWELTLDGRAPEYVDTVLVPQGFYAQDSPTLVTFTPHIGFLGTAAPVTLRLSGPGGVSRTETYTATVTLPPKPVTPDVTSTGKARAKQQIDFDLPAGGRDGYVDPDSLDIPQGVFSAAAISGIAAVPGRPFDPTLIGARGFLIFTPNRGVHGVMPTVRYSVTDAYGQTSIGHWTPTVTGY